MKKISFSSISLALKVAGHYDLNKYWSPRSGEHKFDFSGCGRGGVAKNYFTNLIFLKSHIAPDARKL